MLRLTPAPQPGWRRFLSACALSQLGRAITVLLLPLVALQMTGSASLAALVAAIEATPTLVLGLFAGAVADRVRVGTLLVLTDITCSAVSLIAAGLMLMNQFAVWTIFCIATIAASAAVFRDAAMFGALRRMGDGGTVTALASFSQTTGAAASLVGPIMAGWLIANEMAAIGLLVDGLCCLGAAVMYAGVPALRGPRPLRSASTERWRHSILTGWRTLIDTPALRYLTFTVALASVTAGAVMSLLPPMVLSRPVATAAEVGVIVALGGVGGLIGAATMPVVKRLLGPGRTVVVSACCVAVLAAVLPLAGPIVTIAACFALWHFAYATLVTTGIAVRLVVAPADLVARVAMTGRMISWGGQPVGAYLAAAVAALVGLGAAVHVMWIAAAGSVVGALVTRTASIITRAHSGTLSGEELHHDNARRSGIADVDDTTSQCSTAGGLADAGR